MTFPMVMTADLYLPAHPHSFLFNLIADVLYRCLDPRIRYD